MTSQWEAQVVGINYYPNYTTLQQLTAAANDAEAVAIQLEQYGYQTFRVQRLPRQPNQKGEWQVDPDEGVRMPELQTAISNLLMPPDGKPPETALFFFSGHGWRKTVNGKDQVFLATSDVLPSQNNYGISIDWLGNLIQNSPVKKLIVWLDCCYSGELVNYLPTDKDYCIFTATRSYEPGIEIRHQEGLFTRELREGLNPNNYADGIVDSHKLAKYIQERMAQAGQSPQCYNSARSILLTSKVTQITVRDECPYRSLSCFTEQPEDANVFYGRTKLTLDLVQRVRNKERLIAVFGASGSGKSSLIRAGLLYQLKLGQEIIGSNNWVYYEPFTPTDDPVTRLGEVLGKLDLPQNPLDRVGETEPTSNLAPIVRAGGEDLTPMILIVDQFEECFSMCDEQNRQAFIDCLIELIETIPTLQMVIGMRSDFRSRLREYPQFTEHISKVNVGHLNREEIQEAIEKPAEFVGLGIESSLKQQLINDVEDYPGSLPLLQYTLTELWNEARKQGEKFLRLSTYQGLGGIEGTLEKRADAVYESLLPEERAVAKRIFLELTQVGDSLDTRRRVKLGDLVNSHHSLAILEQVTQKLANQENRLITRTAADFMEGTDASKIIIDVVHEALIRHWKLLGNWKRQYQTAMIVERKIEAAAQEWEAGDKKPEYLLQESRLAEAEEYVKDFSDLGMLDGMGEEFIGKSIDLRSRNRWIRGGIVSLFVAIVALGGISSTIFGLMADREAKVAKLREQGATVINMLSLEPVDALLLAIQSTSQSQKQLSTVLPQVQSSLLSAIQTSKESKNIKGNIMMSTAISLDGQTIASVNLDGVVQLWDKHGNSVGKPYKGGARVSFNNHIAISPNGKTIVTGGGQDIQLWDRESQSNHRLIGHKDEVNSVTFSTNGNYIVSGSKDKTIRLWDKQGNPVGKSFIGHEDNVNSVAFSTNGNYIVSGSKDKTIRLWDKQGNPVGKPFIGHEDEVNSVAFSTDGNYIVSGSKDKTIRLWNLQGKSISEPLKGHKYEVKSVAVSPDGKFIVSASWDGTLRWWDLQGDLVGSPFKQQGGIVYSVAFSPDGKTIASASGDGTVSLLDIAGNSINKLQHQGSVSSVSFSSDGKTILSGSNGIVYLWNRKGNKVNSLEINEKNDKWLTSVAISNDGQTIVASNNGYIKLWDGNGNIITKPFKAQDHFYTVVAISEDGNTIASGSWDKKIKLWDRKGVPIGQPFSGHQSDGLSVSGDIFSIAISKDGQLIASASNDRTIRLWNRQGKLVTQPLRGHEDSVTAVAISPDGNYIVSGSKDKTVRLWDREGNVIGQPFRGHKDEIKSVAFSPDGKYIVSGGVDKTVRIWSAGTWKNWLEIACSRLRFHPILISPQTETAKEAEETCLKDGGWDAPQKAEFLGRQGFALAQEEGDFEGAKAKFKQAQSLDSSVNLAELETSAIKLVVQKLIDEGKKLAVNGNIEGSIAKFKQAQKLDDRIDLAELEASTAKLIASQWIEKGKTKVAEGNVTEALALYNKAQKLDPTVKIDAASWNVLCYSGSIYRHASDVMFACENAVQLASAEEKGNYQDSRGLAKAVAGDKQGAIVDFQASIDDHKSNPAYKPQRKKWIEALKKGKNPFTDEVLQSVKDQ